MLRGSRSWEGSNLFHSWFSCGAGTPIWPLPWSRSTRARRARDVSLRSFVRATWPSKARRRLETILFNGCWEVRRRISTLVASSDQQTPQIRLKYHWSNASIMSLSDWTSSNRKLFWPRASRSLAEMYKATAAWSSLTMSECWKECEADVWSFTNCLGTGSKTQTHYGQGLPLSQRAPTVKTMIVLGSQYHYVTMDMFCFAIFQ